MQTLFRSATLEHTTYDIRCQPITLSGAPFASMICEVEPGKRSRIHNHIESELFFFLEGQALVHTEDGQVAVRAGDGVVFEPFSHHVIENVSPHEPLRFLSVYWERPALDASRNAGADAKPSLVFSTPPTPNGDLHLGHLSGPYLAADVVRRAIAQRGAMAAHVTGRDDNQTYVLMKAMKSDTTPEHICDQYSAAICDTLTKANIPLQGFIRPTRDGAYAGFVAAMMERLYERGHLYVKRDHALFGQDGAYLHEAYVRGGCPHCGQEADGNACEACGRPNACVDLVNPVDRRTGGPVQVREIDRLFFRFSAFAAHLSDVIKECRLPARVFALAQRMIDEGLPDICVSHPSSWGLPVTIPGFTDQVIYVWFEMAAGYLFGAGQTLFPELQPWDGAIKAFSGEVDIIHTYGFDNAYYHALLFPAVYRALDLDLKAPSVHIVNELLDLDGQKFSTSRNHLIWGRDLLAQVPVDAVRFGLAKSRPQGRREDFSLARFVTDTNHFFAGTLDSWLQELVKLAEPFAGIAPDPGAWLADHRAYHQRMLDFVAVAGRSVLPATFAPHELASELAQFASDSRRFVQAQMALHLTSNGHGYDYLRTAVALAYVGVRAFSVLAAPLLPETAAQLCAALGVSESLSSALEWLGAGNTINSRDLPRFNTIHADATFGRRQESVLQLA